MNIDDSVGYDVDISVSSEVGIGNDVQEWCWRWTWKWWWRISWIISFEWS